MRRAPFNFFRREEGLENFWKSNERGALINNGDEKRKSLLTLPNLIKVKEREKHLLNASFDR